MQINKQTFLAGLSCILSVVILTTTIPIAFKGEKEMATIITIANGAAGSVVRGAINDNFDEVNTELEADTTAIGTNTTAIGTLASLTTTEKSSLVGAINEVNSFATAKIYGELYITGGPSITLANNTSYYSPSTYVALKYGEGVTLNSNALKIGTAGYYLVSYNLGVYSSNSEVIFFTHVLKNGTALTNGATITSFQSDSYNYLLPANCSFIESFAANDLVKIGIKKYYSSDTSVALTFQYMYISVVKIS